MASTVRRPTRSMQLTGAPTTQALCQPIRITNGITCRDMLAPALCGVLRGLCSAPASQEADETCSSLCRENQINGILVTISKQTVRLNKNEMSSAAGRLHVHLQEVNANNTSCYGCVQSVTCNYHELIDICIISKVTYFRGAMERTTARRFMFWHDVLL